VNFAPGSGTRHGVVATAVVLGKVTDFLQVS
jgi:hypothetical protein